jgi:hypothetical protein
MASTEGDSSAFRTQVLLSQPPVQNSCQLTTQWTGSQAGGHFTPTSWSSLHMLTSNWTLSLQQATSLHFTSLHFTSLHFTSLNWSADKSNSVTRLTMLLIFRREPHRKHRFHCYKLTIPWLLHAYPLTREPFTEQLPNDSPGIFIDVFIGRCLETSVSLFTYCIATAVLVRFEVSAQQRVHKSQYYIASNGRMINDEFKRIWKEVIAA